VDIHVALSLIVLAVGWAIPCSNGGLTVKQTISRPILSAPRYPGFAVHLTLSEKARKLLGNSKETVIVIAYLTGDPKPGASKRFVSRPGPIGLGEIEVEVPPGEDAKFKEIEPRADAFEETDKKVPRLLINVVSGRKSSKDNLLECDIYEGALVPIANDVIPISCKLIVEQYPLHS
jgi:hypothetical protein